ncbi:MAG: TonB-dependent receptor [Caulobacterales bacterium]|nr:TonB-dependent receptor [Caulobacterales bacterium]
MTSARVCAAAAVAIVVIAAAARAQAPLEPARFELDLPAMPLADALGAIAERADVSLVYDTALAAGRRAPPLQGTFDLEAALEVALGAGRAETVFLTGTTVALIAAEPPASPPPAEPRPMREIMVTVGKRRERLQEAPVAATAVTADTLAAIGARDFFDFAPFVPNLSFAFTGDGRHDARGIALRSVVGEATTGLYIDDAPLQESLDPRIFEIERVEVMRGPQGVLFGSQSMGGAVRIVTRAPGAAPGLRAAGSAASVAEGGLDAAAHLTLDRAFAFGGVQATAYGERLSGVFDRVASGPDGERVRRENVDGERTWGLRAAALWSPRPDADVQAFGWWQATHSDSLPFADVEAGRTDQNRLFDLDEPGSDEWGLAGLTGTWRTPAGEAILTTSYARRTVRDSEDVSELIFELIGGPEPIPVLFRDDTRIRTWSMEARFASDREAPVALLAGLFADRERVDAELPEMTVAADGEEAVLSFLDAQVDVDEIAAFGEASWRATPRLTVSAGARAYAASIHVERAQGGLLFADASGSFANGRDDEGINPKLTVAYKAARDTLWYASAARGFRLGGVNPPLPSEVCGPELAALGIDAQAAATFAPDSLWSFEAGLKSASADGRFVLNAAAFSILWDDVQQTLFPACGFPFRLNLGDVEAAGAEIEISAALSDALRLRGAVGYTDAAIRRGAFEAIAASGDRLDQAPAWTASAMAAYDRPLAARAQAFVVGDARFVGASVSFTNSPAEPRRRDAYVIANARGGVRLDGWELGLFARNLTNARVDLSDNRSIAVELPGRPRIVTNRLRTIGVEARVSF